MSSGRLSRKKGGSLPAGRRRTLGIPSPRPGQSLRGRILIGLNKGEALHSLARQLFSGKHGELWDRAFEDQMHRASCLHLIMAAIAAWNAVYLSQAVEELKKRGEALPEEYLPHITPLGWEHINLIGQYSFTHQPARSLDNLRPLRLPEQEDQAEGELVKTESSHPSQALQTERMDG